MPTVITGTDGINQVQAGAVESGDLPAGSVIQVVQATSATNTNTTSTSLLDVEPSVTITPSSSNNKILVMHTAGGMSQNDPQSIKFELQRNGVSIWVANRYGYKDDQGSGSWNPIPFNASYLDSPNTTSSVTYNFAMRQQQAAEIRHNSDVTPFSGTSKAITIAMEIAG